MPYITIRNNNGTITKRWVPDGTSGSTSSGSTSSGSTSGGSSGGSSSNDQLVNLTAAQLAAQVANNAAQIAFQRERFEKLELPQFQFMTEQAKEEAALKAATFEWQKAYQESLLTGYYEGKPTAEWLATQAGITGYFEDQPTLQREQFTTQATGYLDGRKTLQREEFEAQTALQMLNLIAQTRGARNAFQMAKVLNGTPQGLRDIVAAAAGQLNIPGYGGSGAAPMPATVANTVQDVLAAGGSGLQVASATPAAPYAYGAAAQTAAGPAATPVLQSPAGTQAPVGAYSYQPNNDGTTTTYPPGVSAPTGSYQYNATTPLSTNEIAQLNAEALATMPLTPPNQVDPKNYSKMGTAQRELLWGAYENQGWDYDVAKESFEKSLPAYAGPAMGSVAGVY